MSRLSTPKSQLPQVQVQALLLLQVLLQMLLLLQLLLLWGPRHYLVLLSRRLAAGLRRFGRLPRRLRLLSPQRLQTQTQTPLWSTPLQDPSCCSHHRHMLG